MQGRPHDMQAKGVLAQYTGLSTNDAFDRLRRYTRNNNLLLSDTARNIVEGNLALDTISPAVDG